MPPATCLWMPVARRARPGATECPGHSGCQRATGSGAVTGGSGSGPGGEVRRGRAARGAILCPGGGVLHEAHRSAGAIAASLPVRAATFEPIAHVSRYITLPRPVGRRIARISPAFSRVLHCHSSSPPPARHVPCNSTSARSCLAAARPNRTCRCTLGPDTAVQAVPPRRPPARSHVAGPLRSSLPAHAGA